MNFLTKAIAEDLLLSSSVSRKRLLLFRQASLYSTSRTTAKSRTPKPQESPPPPEEPSWSALSWAEVNTSGTTTKPKTVKAQDSPSPPKAPSSSPYSWAEVNFSGKLKNQVEAAPEWPRPSEIIYQSKVANLVNLIGRIQKPVEFHSSPDGKNWAFSVIAQQSGLGGPSSSSSSLLIPVVFGGDLAHVVACHVKVNDCVYISGHLSVDPLPFLDSKNEEGFHVTAQNINFVQGAHLEYTAKKTGSGATVIGGGRVSGIGSGEHVDDKNVKKSSKGNSKGSKGEDPILNAWRDLIRNPNQWWDNRDSKRKGKLSYGQPDFKHKESGTALWLNRAPTWVLPGLQGLEFDVEIPKMKTQSGDKDDSWRSLIENPDKWWDNRSKKNSSKSPDFKSKEIGEGLWLDAAPDWAKPQLVELEFDSQSLKTTPTKNEKYDPWKNLIETPDEWWDNRSGKRNVNAPDFKHKKTDEALWLKDSPAWVLSRLEGLEIGAKSSKTKKIKKGRNDDSWKKLLENPDEWWDNRFGKKNVKSPDFKHKETGEALWLSDSPEWVLSQLEGLESANAVPKAKKTSNGDNDDSWKNLVENPSKWLDNRSDKKSANIPDFEHKETGEGLWISDSPNWALPHLDGLEFAAGTHKVLFLMESEVPPKVKQTKNGKKDDSWKSLVDNPGKWWDNRSNKKNAKAPDFKHKQTGEVLWLNSSPDWAISKLPPLKPTKNTATLDFPLAVSVMA